VDAKRNSSARRWIVDPLDGTTNYSHGHPFFAVSIGLEEARELVAGVVAAPALGVSMWARKGGGAFYNGEKARVSSQEKLEKSLVATGFPYDRRESEDNNTSEHSAFIKTTQGVRRCGSAAIDLVLVARGIQDGYWEPKLYPWDLAAGVVLVREAGGRVTDYHGEEIDIHEGWVLASNGLIHDQMVEILRKTRAP
jgi:myo-inositol-1(or 4)-monophosphatase